MEPFSSLSIDVILELIVLSTTPIVVLIELSSSVNFLSSSDISESIFLSNVSKLESILLPRVEFTFEIVEFRFCVSVSTLCDISLYLSVICFSSSVLLSDTCLSRGFITSFMIYALVESIFVFAAPIYFSRFDAIVVMLLFKPDILLSNSFFVLFIVVFMILGSNYIL
jgi:hypothetical protein